MGEVEFANVGTNIPNKHPEGFILKGWKSLAEAPTPDSPNAKAQRLEEGSLSIADKTDMAVPLVGRVPPTPPTRWDDVGIDTLWFRSSHLPFSKEFLVDYQALCSKPSFIPFEHELHPYVEGTHAAGDRAGKA